MLKTFDERGGAKHTLHFMHIWLRPNAKNALNPMFALLPFSWDTSQFSCILKYRKVGLEWQYTISECKQ